MAAAARSLVRLIGAHPATPRLWEWVGVYEFRFEDGRWRETALLDSRIEANANFGFTIAMQGDAAVIGAPGSGDGHGAAFLHRRDPSTGAWTEQSRLTAFNSIRGDRFGGAVALDGNDVWIGAPTRRGEETGQVYVYSGRGDGQLLDAPRRIRLTETVTRDAFGDLIVSQGGVAAIWSSGMHHQAGAVYVYERDATGQWLDNGMLVSAPDALAAMVGEERKCTDGRVGPFDCNEVELLSFVPSSMLRANGHARAVCGPTTTGDGLIRRPVREYALVGRNDGTSFVDLTDPVNPGARGRPSETRKHAALTTVARHQDLQEPRFHRR